MDIRNKGTLLTYYFTPLVFFFVMGAVFSSISPMMKSTLSASMTIFAVTMGSIMGTPAPLVKMRESGAMRAFKVNGITNGSILAVSLVSTFLHLLIVSIIIYITAPIVYQAGLPANPMLYFLVLFAFILSSASIGILIGVYAKGQSFATMLSMIVFMPSLLLSGIMFPASMLPKAMSYVGYAFPAAHAMQALNGLAYNIETDINSTVAVAAIILIGIAAFALAALRLKSISKNERM